MLIVHEEGLSQEEIRKILRPYAKNNGEPVNCERAGAAAAAFIRENPGLLRGVGELLDKAQG